MARIARGFGYILLGLAAVLALIGASTWPPGGLMFALPFVFFIPAAFLALIGGAFVWFARRQEAEANAGVDTPPGEGSI